MRRTSSSWQGVSQTPISRLHTRWPQVSTRWRSPCLPMPEPDRSGRARPRQSGPKETHVRCHCVLAASRLKCERASAASLSVSWPAGKCSDSRADCPDQRFVKSPEPSASAFARKGARRPPANGKTGAESDSGPISRMSLFRIPRAGRPVKTLVTAVPSSEGERKGKPSRSGQQLHQGRMPQRSRGPPRFLRPQ